MLYSKTKNINNDINSILSTDRWANKMVESDIRAILITLYQSHTEQLGIIITNYIVYIYTTPQEGLKMSPFKANYGYILRISLILRQAKKTSELA